MLRSRTLQLVPTMPNNLQASSCPLSWPTHDIDGLDISRTFGESFFIESFQGRDAELIRATEENAERVEVTNTRLKRTTLQLPWSLGRNGAQGGTKPHGCIVDWSDSGSISLGT